MQPGVAQDEAKRKSASQTCACVVIALTVTSLVIAWQALTVRVNYSGNWTALFWTGDRNPPAPSLASEGTYTFANSAGYDRQFYRYIAHDPFLQGDSAQGIDAPRMRYRRILIPPRGVSVGRRPLRQDPGGVLRRDLDLLLPRRLTGWPGSP